jgi:hypothetical protein
MDISSPYDFKRRQVLWLARHSLDNPAASSWASNARFLRRLPLAFGIKGLSPLLQYIPAAGTKEPKSAGLQMG